MTILITNTNTHIILTYSDGRVIDLFPSQIQSIDTYGDSVIISYSYKEEVSNKIGNNTIIIDSNDVAAYATGALLRTALLTMIDTIVTIPSNKYTDPEVLVTTSDIGAVDDTWVDQGSPIDCRGYNTIGIFVVLTVNDSTGNQLQVLPKLTSGGADEFILDTISEYQRVIGDATIKIYYEFIVSNSIPFIQIQTKATDVDTGGGTEGTVTINITKGY